MNIKFSVLSVLMVFSPYIFAMDKKPVGKQQDIEKSSKSLAISAFLKKQESRPRSPSYSDIEFPMLYYPVELVREEDFQKLSKKDKSLEDTASPVSCAVE